MIDFDIELPGEKPTPKKEKKASKVSKALNFDRPNFKPEQVKDFDDGFTPEPLEREVFTPYAHQTDAFNFIKDLDAWALFMEQGTGKSKVVMMKSEQLYSDGEIDRLLVICPSALKHQWKGEVLRDHCPMDYVSIDWDGFTTKRKQSEFKTFLSSPKFKVMAINYEAFLPESRALDYVRMFLTGKEALIVCDESTKIKSPEAKRTKKILSGFKKRRYKGILTGTPTPNSPFDLWAQFDFLKTGFFHMKYFHFKKHYCIMVKRLNPGTGRPFDAPIDEEQWKKVKRSLEREVAANGKLDIGCFERVSVKCDIPSIKDIMEINQQAKYTPYKNLEELRKFIDPLTFRCKKEDCLDLPEKVYCKLEVDLSSEQKKAIKELKKDMLTTYAGKELSVPNALTLTCRLQMITGGVFPYHDIIVDDEGFYEKEAKYTYMKSNPKIKALLEDLETVSVDDQIIIWATFVSELELIYSKLIEAKYDTRIYYGKTPHKERHQIEEAFKQGKFRVLVINPALGDMGLNFQNCTLHYFYSNSHRADRRLQAEDRSHRIGQTNKVTYKDIICLDSIDQKIAGVISRKEDLINYFRNKHVEDVFNEEF